MRLTKRLLEAIAIMANQVEAGGTDEVQGMTGKEQADMYEAMMDARSWAEEELYKREKKSIDKPK